MKRNIIPIISLFLLGCKSDTLPKPKGYLSLEYPKAEYKLKKPSKFPFQFEYNSNSNIEASKTAGLNIAYPKLKATIYLSYKEVKQNNLDTLLRDAQNLTQKHTIKADEIFQNEFINPKTKVYGMFYEVAGNAATQSQFYVTDSLNHFITGALYFYSKPNYDSILPASEYIKKDLKHLIESLEWNK